MYLCVTQKWMNVKRQREKIGKRNPASRFACRDEPRVHFLKKCLHVFPSFLFWIKKDCCIFNSSSVLSLTQ